MIPFVWFVINQIIWSLLFWRQFSKRQKTLRQLKHEQLENAAFRGSHAALMADRNGWRTRALKAENRVREMHEYCNSCFGDVPK